MLTFAIVVVCPKSTLESAINQSINSKMTKTAVNAITPLEPFKLFHYINQNVLNAKQKLEKFKLERMDQVSVPGRSNQPVGMAQIGFACFWPNGGGLLPPGVTTASPSTAVDSSSDSGSISGNSTQQLSPEEALVSSSGP